MLRLRLSIFFSAVALFLLLQYFVLYAITNAKGKHIDMDSPLVRKKNDDDHTWMNSTSSKEQDIEQKYVLPQQLTFGPFREEKGQPFITQDFWADIVDNERTFFMRPGEAGEPSPAVLLDWIRSRPHPIVLVINNQADEPWPVDLDNRTAYEMILNETNLHRVFAGNARNLKKHPKLQPLPIGLKWNFRSTQLFSEPKNGRAEQYKRYCAGSPSETEELFYSKNRTLTVYFRPMSIHGHTRNYIQDTPALKASRGEIAPILKETANRSMVFAHDKLSQELLLQQLKIHRFVISPAGNGLDSHATWEALLCGCIPIVPRSDIDLLFKDLPVWLVDSWDEVTDAAVREKGEYFESSEYKWEKVYRLYWEKEIYRGLGSV